MNNENLGKEVTPEMLFDKNEGKNLQPWEEWDEKKRQEDEKLKQLINGSVVYVVKYEGDSLSEAFYQAYKPDGTKDDNYPLQYPVDTGFWIVPSDDPEYKDYVFDVCGRKWPYKVIPRENKEENKMIKDFIKQKTVFNTDKFEIGKAYAVYIKDAIGDLTHYDMLLKKKDDNMLYFTYVCTGNNLYEERVSIDKYLDGEYEIYELEKVIPTNDGSDDEEFRE